MEIVYTKMQGAGNDFIVIDNRRYNFSSKQLATVSGSSLSAEIFNRRRCVDGCRSSRRNGRFPHAFL